MRQSCYRLCWFRSRHKLRSEAIIARERLALEEAIRKVEREAERRFGNDPPRPSPDENFKDMARRLEGALRRPIKPVEPAPEPPRQRRREEEDRCQDEESDGLGGAHMPEPVPPPSNADVEVKQAIKRRAGELGRDLLREKTGLASTASVALDGKPTGPRLAAVGCPRS